MEDYNDAIDQRGSSVMWGHVFTLIYRLSCRATLIEIGIGHSPR
jgi:hypothetical protein